MPSVSKKQARTMLAAARNRAFAKKMDIPQSVAREYAEADKRRNAIKNALRKIRSKP